MRSLWAFWLLLAPGGGPMTNSVPDEIKFSMAVDLRLGAKYEAATWGPPLAAPPLAAGALGAKALC
jgi:hypothetical protein